MHFDPSSNVVDAHIARLRKKLSAATASLALVMRRGLGFILQAVDSADVRGADDAAQDEYGLRRQSA